MVRKMMMMMSVALLGALSLAAAPATVQAAGSATTGGKGLYDTGGNLGRVQFSFSGILHGDGDVVGHAKFEYPDDNPLIRKLQAEIDCIDFYPGPLLGENRAT